MVKKQTFINSQIAFGGFHFLSLRKVRTKAHGFLLLFLLLCFTSFAAAQSDDRPRAEFFGGYSVLSADYNTEFPDPFQPVGTAFDGKQTLNGLNVSATGYLTKRFGLTGDFSAHFKTNNQAGSTGGNIKTNICVINIMGGPQYKFRNSSRVTPFARALGGIAITRSKLSVALPNINTSGTSSSTDFALAVGGGLDVRVNKRLDLRVFQVDYNPIFLRRNNELGFGNARADNVRFSFGVVFK